MNSARAIYLKQFADILKNSNVLIPFILYPAMTFMMQQLIGPMPGMPESFFITMFAGMFAGMAILGAVAPAIAEDIEKNSLRFLMMAGVKSHEYLAGIGGVFLTFSLAGCIAFALQMPGASPTQMLLMTLSMLLACAASILLGGVIGLISKNEQEAIGTSSLAGVVISFVPFIANVSQNETLQRIFRFLYTMNLFEPDISTSETIERFGIIFANVVVLSLAFAWVYGKNKGGTIVNKKAISTILTAAIIGGLLFAGLRWHNAGFIATSDAQVATVLIPVPANGSGVLERFALLEGQSIRRDEVLGWVQNGDAMRAPADGMIVQVNAVQGQLVSSMETVALISDTSRIHIRANIEETDILHIYPGQRVYVRIDTFGQERFPGYVSNIGSVTLPEDTLMGPSRPTLRIPVDINLTSEIDLSRLIGVNADIRIPLR